MKYAAVMGCGVVGSGVVDILDFKSDRIGRVSGGLKVKYILDVRTFSDERINSRVIRDIDVIVSDPEISVVAETMGGVEPAFTFCMKCLSAGKSVVTSNKALVAAKAPELFACAREHNVKFMFEASVCGGIPLIDTMFTSLSSNEINSFAGILNGTTNFILTRMKESGMSFSDALLLAQKSGYAEKDPTADIEGIDAARKTAILASIIMGSHVYENRIYTKGITEISLDEADAFSAAGYTLKLIGRAEKTGGGLYAYVAPMAVKNTEILSGVSGVNNGICLAGDSVGEVFLYGPGAGKEATASAVTGDMLRCVRNGSFEPHYSWKGQELIPLSYYDKKSDFVFLCDFVPSGCEKLADFSGRAVARISGVTVKEALAAVGTEVYEIL